MRNIKLRALVSLMIVNMTAVLNAFGQSSFQPAASQPSQTKTVPMLAEATHVQTETAFLPLKPAANSDTNHVANRTTEPHFIMGTNTLVTGLIVDCLEPKATWKMLNPQTSATNLPTLTISSPPAAVAAQVTDNNLANHHPDFAVLRFSLGSPPQLPKSQP